MPTDEVTIGDIAIAAETLRESSKTGIAAVIICFIYLPMVCCICWAMTMRKIACREMEGLEIDLLAQMKIANPYHDDHPFLVCGRLNSDFFSR